MERDVTQLLLLKAARSIERVELNGTASFRKCDPVSRETSDRVVNSLMQELFCQNFFFSFSFTLAFNGGAQKFSEILDSAAVWI